MVFGNLLKPPHLKRFLLALAAGGLAMIIYLTADRFQVVPGTAALDEEIPKPPALGERSILVGADQGDCPGNAAFALALEVIRQLARFPEIQVISPRSALIPAYTQQDPEAGTPDIETTWRLEISCSSRSGGNRFSASLAGDKSDSSSWDTSLPYTGAQYQAFISEITTSLARHFEFEVAENAASAISPDMYGDYLLARWTLHNDPSQAVQAQELLDGVLQAAPGWPPALAARAYARLLQPAGDATSAAQQLRAAQTDLDKAIELDETDPDANLYLGIIAHRFEWDWRAAYEATQRALARAPGDADALVAASTAAFTLGRFEEGAELLRRAIPLDPLVLGHRLRYGLMLEFNGQPRAAIEAYRELKIRSPYYPGVHAYLGRALIVGDRAGLALPHMKYERDAFWRDYGTILALYAMERTREASSRFEKFIDRHQHEAAVQIAEIYAFSGQADEAFEWLERAIDQRDPGVAELVGNPLLSKLFDDPRWESLLEELGLPGPEESPRAGFTD